MYIIKSFDWDQCGKMLKIFYLNSSIGLSNLPFLHWKITVRQGPKRQAKEKKEMTRRQKIRTAEEAKRRQKTSLKRSRQ